MLGTTLNGQYGVCYFEDGLIACTYERFLVAQ
jgi:hypothetical protein